MNSAAIFEDLTALADATRSRMLLVLERHELTVSELCSVLQLPQSTVSRHLKTLADASWVTSRRDGTSRYYSLALPERNGASRRSGEAAERRPPSAKDDRDGATRRLWSLLRDQLSATPGAEQDGRRLKGVLARRQTKSEEFFASSAGQWDRLRRELFGGASALHAIPALLDARWVIGDLGCGTGETSAAIAPYVARTIAVDRSGEMLQAARRRLRACRGAEVRRGELESLPIDDGELDAAVMVLVLHHVPDPAAALAEAARALKPGGRIVVCDMLPHDHEEYKQQMGHVWLGFSEDQAKRLLGAAGFADIRIVPRPTDDDAKGPALFVASATKQE
jgi:ArsR family transcriptional regulator